MTIDLSGKTALVTGASKGIGAAAAKALAASGAAVVLAARSVAALKTLEAEITAAGGRALATACDVAHYAPVAAAVETAVTRFGGLDILVNNAGVIDPIAHLASSDPDAWGQVVDINYKGVYHGLRAALPMMVARKSGVIVNISSGAATNALEGWSHYCSTKAAVLMLTRCADREYRQHGIRVVGLSPGTVATDMQRSIKTSGINAVSQLDWDRHITPDEAAQAVLFLCSDQARDLVGDDFSIKTPEGRARAGLG